MYEKQGHVCELPKTLDDVGEIANWWDFKQIWPMWSSVHKRATPRCNQYMDSISAVDAERKRHSRLKYWWIVHPFSFIRFLWESLMVVIYGVAFLTIPFMISFIVMDYELIRLDKVNILIYIVCWLDIIGNCITGYHDKNDALVELRPSKIFKKYVKGYFVSDVLSSLPYDHITLKWRKLPGKDSYHSITLINILPFLKLARYPTLNANIFQLFQYFTIEYFYYQLTTTLLLGFYLIIWFSCLCYLLPVLSLHFLNIPSTECDDCWMVGIEKEGLAFRFQHALFIVLENLLASGYGVFPPKTDIHIILNTVLMIFGRIRASSDAAEIKFQEIISQVEAYTRQKQLPLQMKNRLLAYYERLRDEIAMKSCRRLVENVTLFRDLPQEVLKSIVKNLKFELYLQNDVIVRSGTHGDCMFFLSTGTVAVLTPTGKEVCHLDDGAHFGEVALLVPDQKRVATVIAIEVCEVYRLDRKDFRKCVVVHSELFATIERIATERIEKTVMVEEQHKRFLMRTSIAHEDARKPLRRRLSLPI
ncbi:hypothetical protein KPH14_007716 [Odynerus spinipes]|uniref:Cyclic nucleotide-binding domain-containing protein n=1 Tax=Odynerus spinipes TaxID=1348599 RepID=A0AAD9VN82_9HYME|nr:hypothetical protein KPH14_007716 [Odynerus spinipes]